jgi:hypothetical protein
MSIVQTVDKHDFVRAFDDYNRSENFSVEAREALFDYLDELSDDTGENIELDVIAICCDYTEYDNARECAKAYGLSATGRNSDILDRLADKMFVLRLEDGGVVVQDG